MTIAFNQFPVNFRVPGQFVEFDSTLAVQGLTRLPQAILLMGQVLTGGTNGQRPARVYSAAEVEGITGRGSMLAQMAARAFAVTSAVPIYILRLADGVGATRSTRTVTLTGAATRTGTVNLYVGDRGYAVSVAVGGTPATVAGALATVINADQYRMVDAASAAGVLTLTARQAGVDAGRYEMIFNRYQGETLPAGLTVVIASLTEGTVNPDVASALTGLVETWYPTVVCPYTDAASLDALETELASRFGPLRQIEGHAYTARYGTVATVSTFGSTRNSPHLSIVDCGSVLTPPYAVAAAVAAQDAAEPDPARPRQTLSLPGVMARDEGGRRTLAERNALIEVGISTLNVDAGGVARIERLTTTYRLNAFGLSDDAYYDVETLRTLATLRYTLRARFAQKYPRHKLGQNGSEGPNVMTPATAAAEIVALYREWLGEGWVEGGNAFEQFKRDLRVEIDNSDPNRLNALIPPDVINQLRVFAAQIQFRR